MTSNPRRRDVYGTIVRNISRIDVPTVKAAMKNLSRRVAKVVYGRSFEHGPSVRSELSQQHNEFRTNRALEEFSKSQVGSSDSVTRPKTQRPASAEQRLNLRDLDKRPPPDVREGR